MRPVLAELFEYLSGSELEFRAGPIPELVDMVGSIQGLSFPPQLAEARLRLRLCSPGVREG